MDILSADNATIMALSNIAMALSNTIMALSNTEVAGEIVAGTWVQTERKAHEQWAKLIGEKPKAAQLLHLLVGNMNKSGAVVASQQTLADMMGCHRNTIKKAITALKDGNWVDVVRVGNERGGVNAYVVNRRVAWADKRENQRYAAFDARIITSENEQGPEILEQREPLHTLPRLGEIQNPVGEGLPPPVQDSLEGFAPDLPATGQQLDIEDV